MSGEEHKAKDGAKCAAAEENDNRTAVKDGYALDFLDGDAGLAEVDAGDFNRVLRKGGSVR